MKEIKLGYEVETGKQINIKPSHLIVTGVTHLSGKTTTLQALIKRSGLKAIIFKTKIGEKALTEGTEVPPFFRDRSDYEFVRSLIEAYAKEKLFLEKGTLMMLCKGSASLIEIKNKVDDKLAEGKLRGLKEEIHIRLQHYLENLIPQIEYANLSKTLDVHDGINIMNLERFSEEAQSLIIQSVADEVLKTMKGVIIVIPEAWKFLPQKYNNPCKRVVESYIRQGATNENYVWIDSQDMAGVDKIPLKQISTWILGIQTERNEVKHTLDQISLPKNKKPKEEEIMGLRTGHFCLSCYDGFFSVYVQPIWMEDEIAIKIAKGEIDVKDIQVPESLTPLSISPLEKKESTEIKFDDSGIRKEIVELRNDFFDKIQELQTYQQNQAEKIYKLESQKQEINEEELISKLLQKMPTPSVTNSHQQTPLDEEALISKVLARVPSGGMKTYEVAPLEKIKKDFLEEAKNNILKRIEDLKPDEKKIIKYIEGRNVEVTNGEIVTKCFILKLGGGTASRISKLLTNLMSIEVVIKNNSRYKGNLRELIKSLTDLHGATEQEIDQVYNHILMEMLK